MVAAVRPGHQTLLHCLLQPANKAIFMTPDCTWGKILGSAAHLWLEQLLRTAWPGVYPWQWALTFERFACQTRLRSAQQSASAFRMRRMNEQIQDCSREYLLKEDADVATRVLKGAALAGPAADRHGRVNGALKPGSSADCIRPGAQDLFAYVATPQGPEPTIPRQRPSTIQRNAVEALRCFLRQQLDLELPHSLGHSYYE